MSKRLPMAVLSVAGLIPPAHAQEAAPAPAVAVETPDYRLVAAPPLVKAPEFEGPNRHWVTLVWNVNTKVTKLYVGTTFCGLMGQGALAKGIAAVRKAAAPMAEAEIVFDAAQEAPWYRMLEVVVAFRALAPGKLVFVADDNPTAASDKALGGSVAAGAPAQGRPRLLPATATTAPPAGGKPLLLGVDAGGAPLMIGGSKATPTALAALRSALSAAAKPAPRPVVLFLDGDATWSRCRALMGECAQAGLANVSFAVFDPAITVDGGESPADCWRRMVTAMGRNHGRQILLLIPPADRRAMAGTGALNVMADAKLSGQAADIAAVQAAWAKHGLVTSKAVDDVIDRYVALVRAPEAPTAAAGDAVAADMKRLGAEITKPVAADALPALYGDVHALTLRFHPEMAGMAPPADEGKLTGLTLDGDSATATAGGMPLRFVRVDGRWFVSMKR